MLRAAKKSTTRRASSITALYKNLENAVAAAIPEGPKYDHAVSICTAIGRKITKTRALSVAEMLLKIKVAGWNSGNKFDLKYYDTWTPGAIGPEEVPSDVLVSLRHDLCRLCREGNIALTERFDA